MKLLRNIAILSGIILSTSTQAATEFELGLIPLELAREANSGNYYKTLPDNFPVPAVPAALGLGVIGSVERGIQQQVLLRNTAPGQEVRAALQAGYQAQGWITLQANAAQLYLCHDQHGTLQIRSTDLVPGEFRTHVSRTRYPPGYPAGFSGAATCAEQLEAIQTGGMTGVYGFLQNLMPVLELPENAVTPNPVPSIGIRGVSGSISGGDAEIGNDGVFEAADTTIAELQQHFALQMQDQGWVADSKATGARSATSVWFKTAKALPIAGQTKEEEEYTLVMTLLDAAEDRWRISVKLQAGDGSARGLVFGSFGSGQITRDFPL